MWKNALIRWLLGSTSKQYFRQRADCKLPESWTCMTKDEIFVKKPSFVAPFCEVSLCTVQDYIWSIAFEWRVLYSADGAWFMAGGEFSGLCLIWAGSVSGICLIWPGSGSFVRICRPADCSIQSSSQKDLQKSLLKVGQFQKSDNLIFARKTRKAKWFLSALFIWAWSVQI